ncbi:MAG: Rid family hydrolase [Cetobacterium sp.]|uniref:Rid family hydrolase n=2 Tax=Cetobacterium sp. TaxID=2071632 RepID=UPI003EE4D2ED
MKKKINNTDFLASIGGIKVNGTIFLSRQVPLSLENMEIVSKDISEQIEQIFKNTQNLLESMEYSLKDIVKVSIYMKNMNDFIKVKKVYRKYLENINPARTLLEVSHLPKNFKIMMDLVAAK